MENESKSEFISGLLASMDRTKDVGDYHRNKRLCRYCEVEFLPEKKNQRFHTSRCGTMYTAGNIHETTFARWIELGTQIITWEAGEDPYDEDGNERLVIFPRARNWARFDGPRANLYMVIAEIHARVKVSNPSMTILALRTLNEIFLKLWTLPADIDLFTKFDCDPSEEAQVEVGFNTLGPLPSRGLAGLGHLAKIYKERWRRHHRGQEIPWWDFINV